MLGFSIGKLLLTAIMILAVWYGFKLIAKDERVDEPRVAEKQAKKTPSKKMDVEAEAEDLVECKTCGSYVAAKGAKKCGREDCTVVAA